MNPQADYCFEVLEFVPRQEENPGQDAPAFCVLKEPEVISGILYSRFKRSTRTIGPVYDVGSDLDGTRVRVYRIRERVKNKAEDKSKEAGEPENEDEAAETTKGNYRFLWRIYWRERGCRKPKTLTRRNEKSAEREANHIHKMLVDGQVSIGIPDAKTVFDLRQGEMTLAGTGMTTAEGLNRIRALHDQTPPGQTIETIFHRGLAACALDAKFNEPISVLKAPFLEWQEKNQRLSKASLKSYSTTLDKLEVIHNKRSVSEINSATIRSLIARHGEKIDQAKAELGRCYQFLDWAQSGGYFREVQVLPTEFIKLGKNREMAGPVKIYPAETLLDIIRLAPETLRPALILVAANLFRPEEAMAMTYEQLFLYEKENWIWLPPSIAKRVGKRTAARWTYLNPITRHLLTPYMKNKGPLCPTIPDPTSGNARFSEFMKKSKIALIHDGIRKSCITAHVVIDASVQKIAKWAGNSESVIQGHYNNRATTGGYTTQIVAGFLGVDPAHPSVQAAIDTILQQKASPPVTLVATDLINRIR